MQDCGGGSGRLATSSLQVMWLAMMESCLCVLVSMCPCINVSWCLRVNLSWCQVVMVSMRQGNVDAQVLSLKFVGVLCLNVFLKSPARERFFFFGAAGPHVG